MSHEYEIELDGDKILLDGRHVATVVPGLASVFEHDLREALDRDVESEIDEARAEAREQALKDVAEEDEDAVFEVDSWRSIIAEIKAKKEQSYE
jgi:hypothetical protein